MQGKHLHWWRRLPRVMPPPVMAASGAQQLSCVAVWAPKDVSCVWGPPTCAAATSPAAGLQGIADKMKGINQVASVAFTPQGDMHMQVRDL